MKGLVGIPYYLSVMKSHNHEPTVTAASAELGSGWSPRMALIKQENNQASKGTSCQMCSQLNVYRQLTKMPSLVRSANFSPAQTSKLIFLHTLILVPTTTTSTLEERFLLESKETATAEQT